MTAPSLDLYWIPLGAGQRVVRTSGKIYERLAAIAARRPRRDLYHSALVVTTAEGRVTIEMAPQPDDRGRSDRGVVAEGPVGSRWLRHMRVFRYEVRRWPDGDIPDLVYSVASPVHVTGDAQRIAEVLELVPLVPNAVWGRDELELGEMWNSNSVVSWVLTQAGLIDVVGDPPGNGRAPGWDAGVTAARREPGTSPSSEVEETQRHRASGRHGLALAASLVAASAWFGAAGLALGFLDFPDRLARRLPFSSTVVGGVALAAIVAVPYSALAVAAWRGDRRTSVASFSCGLLMIGWIAVEVLIVREVSFLQPLMCGVGVTFALLGRRGRDATAGSAAFPSLRQFDGTAGGHP